MAYRLKKRLTCRYCGTTLPPRISKGRRDVCLSNFCGKRRLHAWRNFFKRERLPLATCVMCNKEFVKNKSTSTCSSRCSKDLKNRREANRMKSSSAARAKRKIQIDRYRKKHPELVAVWRERARLRHKARYQPVLKFCAVCIKEFFPASRSETCSPTCHSINFKIKMRDRYLCKPQPERYCECGVPLSKFKAYCEECAKKRYLEQTRKSRRRGRYNRRVVLMAAHELGLVDRPTARRKHRDITYRALNELGLIPKGEQNGTR